MYITAFLRYSVGVYTADWSIIGDTVWLYMSINIIGQSKTINNSNLVVEVEMISPVRWDGSLSAGISPALEVSQFFFLVIFGILQFIYFWRCVFSWIAVKFERVLAFHKLEGMSNFLLDDIFEFVFRWSYLYFWMAVKFETCFLPIFGLFQWYVMKRAGELIVIKRGGVGSV